MRERGLLHTIYTLNLVTPCLQNPPFYVPVVHQCDVKADTCYHYHCVKSPCFFLAVYSFQVHNFWAQAITQCNAMQWSSSEHDVEHAHYSCQICHLKKCTQCNKCRKLLLQCTFVCLLCAGWPAFVCWVELEVWFKSWRQRSTTASGSSPSSAGQKWKSSKETLFCEAFSIGIRCWWNGRETCTAKRVDGKWVGCFFLPDIAQIMWWEAGRR